MTLLPDRKLPVVDASVAIKWYLPEVHCTEARLMVEESRFVGYSRLHIPDLFFPECGNILWKHLRRGEISKERVTLILDSLLTLPFEIHSHSGLMEAAMEIAAATDRSVYDSLYVALAVQQQTKFVTADVTLYRPLRSGPLASYLLWVEDIKDIL